MTDYSKGKIYKIVCNESGEVYIGSTVQTLKLRLCHHNYGNKDCSSRQIINRDDYQIILIQDYPCDSHLELRMREQYYMDKIPNINKHRAYTTEEQLAIHNKEYYKEYRSLNKEKLTSRMKEYRSLNKEKRAIYDKKMRAYQNTFCGNYHHNNHNNLLRIDINLFN